MKKHSILCLIFSALFLLLTACAPSATDGNDPERAELQSKQTAQILQSERFYLKGSVTVDGIGSDMEIARDKTTWYSKTTVLGTETVTLQTKNDTYLLFPADKTYQNIGTDAETPLLSPDGMLYVGTGTAEDGLSYDEYTCRNGTTLRLCYNGGELVRMETSVAGTGLAVVIVPTVLTGEVPEDVLLQIPGDYTEIG